MNDREAELLAEIKVQTNAANAAAELVGAMAEKLSATMAERDSLRAALSDSWYEDVQAIKAERLRAVVEAAVAFAEVAERPGPHADPMAQAEEYVATRRALIQAVSALDGSGEET